MTFDTFAKRIHRAETAIARFNPNESGYIVCLNYILNLQLTYPEFTVRLFE